jgi:hypothetical protein
MPTLRLDTGNWGPTLPVVTPQGPVRPVYRPRLYGLLRVPGWLAPLDAVIDTGAPLTCFPEDVWGRFHEGTDFEWLPFAPGVRPPVGQYLRWQFTFRMARFLVPLGLMDYVTAVDRPDVIAQFAVGNPVARGPGKAPPPILIGLWGGLIEGCDLRITRTPAGQVAGELVFP